MSHRIVLLALISLIIVSCSDTSNTTARKPLPPVTEGLLAFFPMDGNFNESVGLIPDGTVLVEGQPQAVPDRKGNTAGAILFSGVDDRASMPVSQSIQNMPLTWCAWIQLVGEVPNTLTIPIGKYLHPSGNGVLIGFELGKLTGIYTIADFESFCRVDANFPNDASWHHVAMSVDAQSGMQLYLDGQPVGSVAWSGVALNSNTTESLSFGQVVSVHPTSPPRRFAGILDDVAMYDRVLSADDVRALYNDR